MRAQVSIITAERPVRIGKAFRLQGGALRKEPGGQMTRGKVEVRTIDGLDDLAAILRDLTPAQALTYGVPPAGASRILTRKVFEEAGRPDGYTTRTNDRFTWPTEGGVLMLDHDPSDDAPALDRPALVAALRKAAPVLADAALLWLPSSSSCIWQGDTELRGIGGQRLWAMVAEAADIPRAGKVLVDRLWLAGLGRFEVSASGALLERTLIDASVWQPSRLDFAGGAACFDGLDQRRGDPVRIEGAVEVIDTKAALPDLTPAERAKLAEVKAAARLYDHQPGGLPRAATLYLPGLNRYYAADDGGRWRLTDAVGAQIGQRAVRYKTLDLTSNLADREAFDRFARPQSTPFWSLPNQIRRIEDAGFTSTAYRLQFQQALATPLIFGAMSILAAAFSLRLMRLGDVAKMSVSAVVLGFAFFFVTQFSAAMGSAEVVPPVVAAWLPPVLTTLAALTLLFYTEDG